MDQEELDGSVTAPNVPAPAPTPSLEPLPDEAGKGEKTDDQDGL